jgi:hypothetical protein
MLSVVDTIDDVLAELGGPAKAAELAGVTPPAASNWKSRGRFPSDLYLLFCAELSRTGKTPDPVLFGLKSPAPEPAEVRP